MKSDREHRKHACELVLYIGKAEAAPVDRGAAGAADGESAEGGAGGRDAAEDGGAAVESSADGEEGKAEQAADGKAKKMTVRERHAAAGVRVERGVDGSQFLVLPGMNLVSSIPGTTLSVGGHVVVDGKFTAQVGWGRAAHSTRFFAESERFRFPGQGRWFLTVRGLLRRVFMRTEEQESARALELRKGLSAPELIIGSDVSDDGIVMLMLENRQRLPLPWIRDVERNVRFDLSHVADYLRGQPLVSAGVVVGRRGFSHVTRNAKEVQGYDCYRVPFAGVLRSIFGKSMRVQGDYDSRRQDVQSSLALAMTPFLRCRLRPGSAPPGARPPAIHVNPETTAEGEQSKRVLTQAGAAPKRSKK